MSRILFTITLLLLTHLGLAQENHQMSTAPISARYEIVQSTQGVRYTFKIDKYSGRVYQLALGETGVKWQPISIEDPDLENIAQLMETQKVNDPDEANVFWQLFLSAHGISNTYLLNLSTGLTLKLFVDSNTKELFWRILD